MKSVKCHECGFVGWADVEACKRCGATMPIPDVDPNVEPFSAPGALNDPPPPTAYSHSNSYAPQPARAPKTGLAIAGLVIGIVNFFTGGILCLGFPTGMILSGMALSKAKRNPAIYGGKDLATVGLVLNIVSFAIIVPITLAIAIPNFVAARQAAYEASVIYSLRSVTAAETNYQQAYRKYGTLDQLESAKLITPEQAASQRNNYLFKLELDDSYTRQATSFRMTASPEYYSSGMRSFYVDETGVIRGADHHGIEATKDDPALGYDYRRSSSRNDAD